LAELNVFLRPNNIAYFVGASVTNNFFNIGTKKVFVRFPPLAACHFVYRHLVNCHLVNNLKLPYAQYQQIQTQTHIRSQLTEKIKMTVNEISTENDEMSIDEMTVNVMTLEEMTVDRMSVDEMTVN
jgi:hypothetical protein